MNKSKSFIKKNSQLFLFLLFFRLLFPLLFSSYVHAPCAHYKERKRQGCIILNEFVVVDVVQLAFAALFKQDSVRFFSLSFSSSLLPPFFFSSFLSAQIHAPGAHHKERNRQVCILIIINKFVFDFPCFVLSFCIFPFRFLC